MYIIKKKIYFPKTNKIQAILLSETIILFVLVSKIFKNINLYYYFFIDYKYPHKFNYVKNIRKNKYKFNKTIFNNNQGNLSLLINFSMKINDSGLFSSGTIWPAFLIVKNVKPSKSITLPAF